MQKLVTYAYNRIDNDDTQRVNYTLVQLLSTVTNDRQSNRDVQLSRVEPAPNNSVNAAAGLASSEVQFRGLPLT